MAEPNEDPLLRSARREAMVSIVVFFAALSYTIGYCTLNAYKAPDEDVTLVFGIPSWVMWGVLLPWGICTVFHCLFSSLVMQDHDLDKELPVTGVQETAGE